MGIIHLKVMENLNINGYLCVRNGEEMLCGREQGWNMFSVVSSLSTLGGTRLPDTSYWRREKKDRWVGDCRRRDSCTQLFQTNPMMMKCVKAELEL